MQPIEILPWNDNFDTGLPIIDQQHQQLVLLINSLAEHLSSHAEQAILTKVFDQLADYVAYHFETEEKVWHQFLSADDLEVEHKRNHEQFITQVQQLKHSEIDLSSNEAIERILRFLIQWLVFHILENDMYMAKVVQAIQSGLSTTDAKDKADKEMRQHINVLVETILNMYEKLSILTLELGREVDTRKQIEAKLRLAANVVENTLDAICITDDNHRIIDANPAFYQTTQFQPDEVLGKKLSEIKSGLNKQPLATNVSEIVLKQGHWSGVVSSLTKTGEGMVEWLSLSLVKSADDASYEHVAIFSEITHLAERLSSMEHLAYHDVLTGLPNRILLTDHLDLSRASSKRNDSYVAVCFLDLDSFKPVNDQYGHDAGDEVLKVISKRLQSVIRINDTVSRVGGDEFVLLLVDLAHADSYKELLDRVLQQVAQPIDIGGEKVKVTASIGVTIYPIDDNTTELLIQHADKAMYMAKQQGHSRYHLFKSTSD
mgnify:CR=1 FL=1